MDANPEFVVGITAASVENVVLQQSEVDSIAAW